jgi:hypothetical protein
MFFRYPLGHPPPVVPLAFGDFTDHPSTSRGLQIVNVAASPNGRGMGVLVTTQNEGGAWDRVDRAYMGVRYDGHDLFWRYVGVAPTRVRSGTMQLTDTGLVSVAFNTTTTGQWWYSRDHGRTYDRLLLLTEATPDAPSIRFWHTFCGDTLYMGEQGKTDFVAGQQLVYQVRQNYTFPLPQVTLHFGAEIVTATGHARPDGDVLCVVARPPPPRTETPFAALLRVGERGAYPIYPAFTGLALSPYGQASAASTRVAVLQDCT